MGAGAYLTSLGVTIVCMPSAKAKEVIPQNPIQPTTKIDAIFMINLPPSPGHHLGSTLGQARETPRIRPLGASKQASSAIQSDRHPHAG